MRLLFVFALLAVVSTIFATCVPSERTLFVPAVVNENRSETVKIGVETKPGTGEVFVSITPAVGLYTQESEKIASDIAFSVAGKKECDVFLRIFTTEGISQVDGPSAGAAITTMLISALRNEPLRDDFSMTGTIERDGSIGLVGGIPLKAEAVAKLGKKLFIVPQLPKSDMIGILLVKRFYNLTVFEADNIETAYTLAVSNKSPEEQLTLQPESVFSFVKGSVTHPQLEYFKKVSSSLINKAEIAINGTDLNHLANFESRLANIKNAFESGQYYYAANLGFLLGIDGEYVRFSPERLRKEIDSVNTCIDSFKRKDKTLENFELTGPAEIRYIWAKNRLPSKPSVNEFISAEFSVYESTLFAKYWCDAATQLNNYPKIGNETTFNETILAAYAKDLIGSATIELGNSEDLDLQWHLSTAKDAYARGMYVASVIDSDFILSTLQVSTTKINESTELINEHSNRSYKYLWPQLFQNHARNFEKDQATAVRMFLFASKLNESFGTIEKLAIESNTVKIIPIINQTNKTDIETGIKPQSTYEDNLNLVLIVFGVIIIAWISFSRYNKSENGREKKYKQGYRSRVK